MGTSHQATKRYQVYHDRNFSNIVSWSFMLALGARLVHVARTDMASAGLQDPSSPSLVNFQDHPTHPNMVNNWLLIQFSLRFHWLVPFIPCYHWINLASQQHTRSLGKSTNPPGPRNRRAFLAFDLRRHALRLLSPTAGHLRGVDLRGVLRHVLLMGARGCAEVVR